MKAKLLAIATHRNALMERMQNVASTRLAAAKPIPSMTGRSLIRFLPHTVRGTLRDARRVFALSAALLLLAGNSLAISGRPLLDWRDN
jgi:hypothetical protein